MRRLSDAKDYILTAILLLCAIAMMISRHDGGLQNARKASITVLSYLEQPLSVIRVYRQALTTNTYLHRQNILLQDELSQLRSVEEQNRILRDLLELKDSTEHSVVPVRIVAKELNGLNNVLTNDTYSQVLPYSNTLFRVSATVAETRAMGIISWPASKHNELVLNHIPQTIELEIGQTVETSGFSNQYPPGLPIGEIIRLEPGDGIETQTVYLKAYADLFTAAEAFVVQFEPDSLIQNLETRQQELF
jgi:rod shape-determining protein MreC